MSDINLDFTVSNNSIDFTVQPNDITITPEEIQLNIYAAGAALAGGANGTVQFNSGGLLGGSTNFTYDGPNSTVEMTNANIGNIAIAASANLGSNANVHITGGSNGYFLRTDGAGNLSWDAGSLGPGGTNTSIQFNNSGSFDGSANLTFNTSTNTLSVTNISANGNGLSSLVGANVTGAVANATFASSAANINAATFAIENVSLIGAQTGTYNFDLLTNVIKYSTANATGNLTLNFRANSTTSANTLIANGQSMTATYLMTTGATAYGVTAVQIDGSAQSIKWVSNITPVQVANTRNSYTFTLIKTSNTPTYTVLGSSTRYG